MKYPFFSCVKFLLIFLMFSSCDKGLDLVPKDSISDATFWKTAEDFKLAANNLYYSLDGISYITNSGDTWSDIAVGVSANSISNGKYQVSEDNQVWTDAYVYIRRCNKIIEMANEVETPEGINNFIAEAKFFRAYNYWKLFKSFGGVPIIKKVLDIGDEELYSSRSSREELVDFILEDLSESADMLPSKPDLASDDWGRITKGAANSLIARIALFEGTWLKFRGFNEYEKYLSIAVNSAEKVIQSNDYSLFQDFGEESYRYLFINEGDDSSETILNRRYERDIEQHGFGLTIQEGHIIPTKKLADMYLCSDGLPISKSDLFEGYNDFDSEFKNRDPRMTMTFLIPGKSVKQAWYPQPTESWPFYPQRNTRTGYTTYKYVSEDSYENEAVSPGRYTYDHHIIRLGEIFLIYAESKYELDGFISNDDLDRSVNLLRSRIGMPPLTNEFCDGNGLNMQEELRRERTIELALEGFRYDDLRRWKTAEVELPKPIKGIKIIGTPWVNPVIVEGSNRNPYIETNWQENTDSDGFIITESADSRQFDANKHYLQPLPTKQILINPELEQNPGW